MANFSDIINASLDLVVPHARREPLNPMAYVRDINEWFVPAAQMALDQMEGEGDYSGIDYALAAIPVVGKPLRKASKVLKPLTKEQRFKAITKANPMYDDYHLGIREVDDVKNLDEVLDDFGNPDISLEMLQDAIKNDKIKVYSSRPIEAGSFVTPSKMMAQDYAGGPNKPIYEIEVSPYDIGWLSGDEGQIARVR